MTRIRLGTRASALAQWQAKWVVEQLRLLGVETELVPIATRGDADRSSPVEAIGTQGVFTSALQQALLAGEIDIAVHSLKDLPTEAVPGLTLSAVPSRGDVEDVLVSQPRVGLEDLPAGAVIGTGSLRRRAQLLHIRPDLKMAPIRGNVETRLRKVEQNECDGILLAHAGLVRLGLDQFIAQILPVTTILPAVGQGALGIETRSDDPSSHDAVVPLQDDATRAAVDAERSMLAHLRGGCLAPIGGWARMESGRLCLSGVVVRHDGSTKLEAHASEDPFQPIELGRQVADDLLAQGADRLIDASREG